MPKPSAAKCPKVVWCVVSATGRIAARGDEDFARLTAKYWDSIYPTYAPHRVCRYALTPVSK